MIEDTSRTTRTSQRDRQMDDRQRARRRGVAPSQYLKPHFVALARQISQWAQLRDESPIGIGLHIGVTSLRKGAGKSTVSFNLASALTSLARTRVLLLEADFGNPYISRRLGNSRSPGLSEVLTGQIEFAEATMMTPMADLDILGCGKFSEQESLELPFEVLAHLVDERLHDYGYVVFDLPLANNLTACHSIVPQLDGIILTVESNQVDQKQILRFRQQVQQHGTDIIGVVINKA